MITPARFFCSFSDIVGHLLDIMSYHIIAIVEKAVQTGGISMKKKMLGMICLTMLLALPGVPSSAREAEYIQDIGMESGNISGLIESAGLDRNSVAGLYYLSAKGQMPLPNSGGMPVRDPDGSVTEYRLEDSLFYLICMPKKAFKPYVSDVKVVSAGSKKAAVEKLISQGCSYYIDENYSSGNDFVLIGYSRTDNTSEAVTDIIGLGDEDTAVEGYERVSDERVTGHILFVTKDTSAGNPIYDIDAFEDVEDTEVSSQIMTDIRLSRGDAMSKQFIKAEDEYIQASESEKTYLMVGADTTDGKDLGIALITDGDGFTEKREAKREMLAISAKDKDTASGSAVNLEQDETVTEESNYDTAKDDPDGNAKDDNEDITAAGDPSDPESEEDTESYQGTVLSVLGGTGATMFFIVLLAIAVVIPIGTVFMKKHIEKKIPGEKTSNEEK